VTMGYQDEQRKFDNLEQWNKNVFIPLGVPTSAYIENEPYDQQRRRLPLSPVPLALPKWPGRLVRKI
jgi:hypothetical protein